MPAAAIGHSEFDNRYQMWYTYVMGVLSLYIVPPDGHTMKNHKGECAMKVTPELYKDMAKQAEPKSNSKVNIPIAFLVGGSICAVGQLLMEGFLRLGLERSQAAAWVSVILVACSAVLTGFGLYEKLARHAGAGTLVPITGFANAVVSPAMEFRSEGLVLGLGAKMFNVAGPVLVYGISASVLYGLVLWFVQLF